MKSTSGRLNPYVHTFNDEQKAHVSQELREMITFCGYAVDKHGQSDSETQFYKYDDLTDLENQALFRKVNVSSQLMVETMTEEERNKIQYRLSDPEFHIELADVQLHKQFCAPLVDHFT